LTDLLINFVPISIFDRIFPRIYKCILFFIEKKFFFILNNLLKKFQALFINYSILKSILIINIILRKTSFKNCLKQVLNVKYIKYVIKDIYYKKKKNKIKKRLYKYKFLVLVQIIKKHIHIYYLKFMNTFLFLLV